MTDRNIPDDRVMHTPSPWFTRVEHDVTGYPCFFIAGMAGDQKRDMPVLEANARLIAASPDLLACARALMRFKPGNEGPDSWLQFDGSDSEWDAMADAAWDALVAAVAKAEGRS